MTDNKNNYAAYYFHQGTNFKAYEYLGVHLEICDKEFKYVFRVWAPNAYSVSVCGDFNDWDINCRMNKITDNGIWELYLKTDKNLDGQCYKYYITGENGAYYKFDPYAVYGEFGRNTASYIHILDKYKWNDESWLAYRKNIFSNTDKPFYPAPLNIYEVNAASWRTRDGRTNTESDAYISYRENAKLLCAYVKEMGYTHIELMPICEHPYDGSWGYQICGYFAPTSRYGTPEDFMYFVDYMHKNGIGVILDWVPAHFPTDSHGLCNFDGKRLYEYQGDDRVEQKGWGTHCFDVGRCEVQSFLISNAIYWLDEYHIDGLRVDAVASMLYLDYDKKDGEWIRNVNGDNINLESVAFFRKLNKAVFERFPDVLMIAEESTAYPLVTHPTHEGGLGFNYKWNMGFANDSFRYISLDPFFRKYNHNSLTFPIMYTYSENFILPISHDEVVHGKKSMIDKCFGDYNNKFKTYRAFMVFFMTYPGKKLLFMGQEFAQFREWDWKNQLEWFIKDYKAHSDFSNFMKELNRLYLERSELWECDHIPYGFEWINPNLCDYNTVIYKRRNLNKDSLICVVNFSDTDRPDFLIETESEECKVIFDSNGGDLKMKNNNGKYTIDLPGLTGVIIEEKTNNGKEYND